VYQGILFECLKISKSFLGRHRKSIVARLIAAEESAQQRSGEFGAFNECLHIGASAVILSAKRADIKATFERIAKNPDFDKPDPSTIVTIAMLYYLLHSKMLELDGAKLTRIKIRLTDMNWLVGRARMNALQLS
jgi:hypothetical protein